jgi:hypothetical protein
MGYQKKVLKASCKQCQKEVGWIWLEGQSEQPDAWLCECNYRNYLSKPPDWPPDLDPSFYLGHEKKQLLHVHLFPPDSKTPIWAHPYSIRSFLSQASKDLGGCSYSCDTRGKARDEPVFSDTCYVHDPNEQWPAAQDCHIAAGWSKGKSTCPLWEKIANLCQNNEERGFLHCYLEYTKYRQFPMLLPQARIGIAERKRPDFIAFVPLHYWKYEPVAIQLDSAHSKIDQLSDQRRDAYLEEQGYQVISIRSRHYLEEVKGLVERFEGWMNSADEELWEVALEAEVSRVQWGEF